MLLLVSLLNQMSWHFCKHTAYAVAWFFAKLSVVALFRYGGEHQAPELQKEAVYGLTELHRDAIRSARLVANPGCYPTSVQLPLVPLLQQGLISTEDIIIDAKSGG